MLSKKYEGTVAWHQFRSHFERHFQRVCCGWTGRYFSGKISVYFMKGMLKAVDMQTAALPQPKCTLYLADAEAAKVLYSTSN
jgi:hypothetical protein